MNFHQLNISFLLSSFQLKKCHKQYRQWGKICVWAEHVWTSFGELTQPVERCHLPSVTTPKDWALNWFGISTLFLFFFQSPPKGESVNEEYKEVSSNPVSELASQDTTPEKGNVRKPTDYRHYTLFLITSNLAVICKRGTCEPEYWLKYLHIYWTYFFSQDFLKPWQQSMRYEKDYQ